jgi:hypothetical protein
VVADLAGDEGAGEGGVERLHHRGPLGDELGDLLGGGGARRRGQPVPGLGVDRVGDVDDDLAGELVGVLLDGVLDARVVDGKDDHLAAEPRSGFQCGRSATEVGGELPCFHRVAVDDLNVVTASNGTGADAAAHVACANDRHAWHVVACSLIPDPPSPGCSLR